jgi:hypothetical protein
MNDVELYEWRKNIEPIVKQLRKFPIFWSSVLRQHSVT